MNAPWIEPSQIVWEDGLNPLAKPAFRQTRNPFVYAALQGPTMVQLRATPGLEMRLYSAPDDAYTTLPPGVTYDVVVNLPPGSWIYGIGGSSAQPEGFLAQVTMPEGQNLFKQPIKSADLNARPLYFSQPQGLPDGGDLKIRVVNQSIAANFCQLVIWVMQPE